MQTLKSMEVDELELPTLPSEQFRAKLQAIIDLHERASGAFDDSRDASCAGARELRLFTRIPPARR